MGWFYYTVTRIPIVKSKYFGFFLIIWGMKNLIISLDRVRRVVLRTLIGTLGKGF
jgi:hypothetical protein